jgi:hypothetical protein
MMSAVARRIRQLEKLSGPLDGRAFLVVASGVGLALGADDCVEILRERGFVATSGFVVVDLLKIPSGLNAKETETYLRKNGADLCSPRRDDSCR